MTGAIARPRYSAALLLVALGVLAFTTPAHCQDFGGGNASRIRSRAVSSCVPTDSQVYAWNDTTKKWDCSSVSSLGGGATITSPNGTINVGGTSTNPTLDVISSPTPGGSANQILSGCGVEYVSALIFNVGACSYSINGVSYSSAATTLTLSAADATNPRIDVLAVDTTSAAVVVAGTAAGSPQQPTLDPATQLGLTFIYVAALATTPTGVTTASIYEENTEWTSAVTAHLAAASTTNPYRGTKDVEATAAVLTNSVTLVKPAAGTETLTNWNNLVFYIRSKAAWPTGTGASAARSLAVFWLSGSTQVGSQVILRDGVFGFSSSSTSAYQQISIPVSLFGTGGSSVTSLRFQVTGNGGSTSIGFYLDGISLQGGFNSPVLPVTLMNFKGAWSSTTAYAPNDTVTSGGIGYVALTASTNVAVTVAASWAPLAGGAGGSTTQMQRNIGGALGGVSGATSDGTSLFVTTQSASDNSTKAASTAYVDAAVSGGAGSPYVVSIALPVGVCQGTTATTGFSLPSSNAPTTNCITGSNVNMGELLFPAGATSTAQYQILAPYNIDCTAAVTVAFTWRAAAITNSVTWGVQTAFVAAGAVLDASWNTATTVAHAPQGTTLQTRTDTTGSITKTGCAAGSEMFLKIYRDSADTMTGNAELLSAQLKYTRTY